MTPPCSMRAIEKNVEGIRTMRRTRKIKGKMAGTRKAYERINNDNSIKG